MFPFRNNRLGLLSVHMSITACVCVWVCVCDCWYIKVSDLIYIHVYLGFMRNYNDDGDGDDDGIISLVIFTILVVVAIVDGAPNCQHVSGNNKNKVVDNNHRRGGSETRATHKPNLCKFSPPPLLAPIPYTLSSFPNPHSNPHATYTLVTVPSYLSFSFFARLLPVTTRAASAKETHSWIM